MVLINIDTLSDSELRYIAKQEELESWETATREELIEELESLYDEVDDVHDNQSGSSKRKFIQTLTDVDSDNVLRLPGVESLPEFYNETEIHLVMRDYNWAYAFWSLSTQTLSEINNLEAKLIIRTVRYDENNKECSSYDIDITTTDSSWTIELPHLGYSYQSFLFAQYDGKETEVCSSNIIKTTESYLSKNPEMLDDETFRKLFPSLLTKGGQVIGNRQVSDLISQFDYKTDVRLGDLI